MTTAQKKTCSNKTRPDTRQYSRGWVGRSGKRRKSKISPTYQPTDTASSRVAYPRLKINVFNCTRRSESADRDGSGLHPDFSARDVSPDDTESVTTRIMRRLNTMGLGFEEVAAFSSGRSSGRSHVCTCKSTSDVNLSYQFEGNSTRIEEGVMVNTSGHWVWYYFRAPFKLW